MKWKKRIRVIERGERRVHVYYPGEEGGDVRYSCRRLTERGRLGGTIWVGLMTWDRFLEVMEEWRRKEERGLVTIEVDEK